MISVKELERLHQILIDKFGGAHGIRVGLLNMWLRTFFLVSTVCATQISWGQDTTCNRQEFAKIDFKKNSSKLTASGKDKLDSLVAIINTQPTCVVLVTSFSADFCDKCGALSWDRQNAVISHLLKKGIEEDRLTSNTQLTGNTDFVTLTFSSWPLINKSVAHPKSKQNN